MDWESISPYIQMAEDQEIIPAIGQEFYDILHTEYQADGSIADTQKAFTFRLIRTALAHYAMYMALPHLNIRVGDAGTNETSASDIVPVRQWVYNKNSWETIKKASSYLDMALKHMEEQVEASNTNYDAFANSTAYTINRELLIPNARVFQKYYNINTSRRTYTKLRPYIEKAEKLYLEPLLSDFYDELSTQHKSNSLSANNEAILPDIQRLLAEYTLVLCVPDLNFVNDGHGYRSVENPDDSPMGSTALMQSIQQQHSRAEQNAAQIELQLKNKLYASLDDYPTFKDSDANELTQDMDDDGIKDIDEVHGPGAIII